ncbi:hypothetical protein QTP86_011412 [Hemibagrus guttatus]|nr:hypothetical protein QTP86_011412 [Hemibagrus guttatus]
MHPVPKAVTLYQGGGPRGRRKVSEYTVHRSLLRMELYSRRPVRVPMLTPVHHQKHQQWALEHKNWTTEQWKKMARELGYRHNLL